jgi:transposase InsO family protein
MGHTAKHYSRFQYNTPTTNCTSTSPAQDTKWLIDSAASHNITGDLANLSIHSEYDGTDEVIIGDGSGLPVSHIGSLLFQSPNRTFHLNDTLCVPNIQKNLISAHQFTRQNHVFIELHPSFFLVKDQITGAVLFRGACDNGVYTLPKSMVQSSPTIVANVHERISIDGWHKRLGHPSPKLVTHLINSFSLPTINKKNISLCSSCSINKAHRQPFRQNSLLSHAPLDLLYIDVWGPSSTIGITGARYYLIFVDHFTKYIWFYPMETKSSVRIIFPQFKNLVENRFQLKIKSVYSDNGGEFVALKHYFTTNGISHYTTAPHTPQQNGVSERHHRHLVETGLTLLHDASLPLQYWPYAFSTAAYLINHQPTPLLQHKSPFEILFTQSPNYKKLKKFGCLCFPLIRPYNTNKLQPKSIPCIFVGYSLTQNAYSCLDPLTNRLYQSRHVIFHENENGIPSSQFFTPSPTSASLVHGNSSSPPTPPPVTSARVPILTAHSGNESPTLSFT